MVRWDQFQVSNIKTIVCLACLHIAYSKSPPVTSKILHLPSSLAGVAGTDYSTYASVPATGFECKVQEFPGIYSDTEAECQVTDLMIIKIIYYWISPLVVSNIILQIFMSHRSFTCANQMEMLTASSAPMELCSTNNTLFVIGGTMSIAKLNPVFIVLMSSFTLKMKVSLQNLSSNFSLN